jgi:AcrR family transcriptional regulator
MDTEDASRRTRRDGRATVSLVMRVAAEELDASGPVAFNLDRVIDVAGVSRSSVYHHFGSRAGLITAVEGSRMLDAYQEANVATREVVRSVKSGEQFFEFVESVFAAGGGADAQARRNRRVASLAAAEQMPGLHELMRDAQRSGMDYYEETLQMAKDRGLIDPQVPLRGIANFIQSVLVGRVLVDLLEDAEADADWVTTTMVALRCLLRPQ